MPWARLLCLCLWLWLLPPAGSKHHNAHVNQLLGYHRTAVAWVAQLLDQHPQDWIWGKGSVDMSGLDPKRGSSPTPHGSRGGRALVVPQQMLKEWQGNRLLQELQTKVRIQQDDAVAVSCIPGIAVYIDPVIVCDGLQRTAPEFIALPAFNASRCNVTGRQTCICARDSAYYMGDQCSKVRTLKCTPTLEDPPLDCPPTMPVDGLGDPACFTIDRTQTVRFKYRLSCALNGEVQIASPSSPDKELNLADLSPTDLARIKGTPYLSVDGRHYELPDWYRDHFQYFLASSDLSLAVSFAYLAQFPRRMYLKAWDFIKLSDDAHKQYKPVRSEHLLGKDVLAFDIDFAKVEDAFLVGGRAYLEAGFDYHRGSHRLFVDINNYLARHAAQRGFSPWIIVAIVLPSVSFVGCCGFLTLSFIRRRRRQKAKKAKALARAQTKKD